MLIYTTHHIFLVLPIKHLINENGGATIPHKLGNGTKPSVSNIHALFSPFVVGKATAHVNGKELNMRHHLQKGFLVIFVGIPQHHKGYLIYKPSTRKIVSSHELVFEETFSSVIACTSGTYSEAPAMRTSVYYIPYALSSHEKTRDIITFAQFEKGGYCKTKVI